MVKCPLNSSTLMLEHTFALSHINNLAERMEVCMYPYSISYLGSYLYIRECFNDFLLFRDLVIS